MSKKYYFYKKEGWLHNLPLEKVAYLESSNNHVIFHGWDDQYLARLPFRLVLDLLYDEKLVKVHRSYAIFLDYIEAIGSDSVIMHTKNRVELPISKRYYPKLMDHIMILLPNANGCGSECDSGPAIEEDQES